MGTVSVDNCSPCSTSPPPDRGHLIQTGGYLEVYRCLVEHGRVLGGKGWDVQPPNLKPNSSDLLGVDVACPWRCSHLCSKTVLLTVDQLSE